jgi:hypothetical protein
MHRLFTARITLMDIARMTTEMTTEMTTGRLMVEHDAKRHGWPAKRRQAAGGWW